jgi:hypothetical protein
MASQRPKIIFGTLAILYCCVQWVGAHSIMGNTIFAAHRVEERSDLELTIQQLQNELTLQCTSGNLRRVLFDDGDVLLPYIVSNLDRPSLGQCELVRSTNVTPFPLTVHRCDTLVVREYTLAQQKQGLSQTLKPYYPGDWLEVSRWVSPQASAAFALFRPAGCGPER